MHVLVVCTGNICRSPAVERLLAHELAATYPGGPPGADGGVEISSAGTYASVGATMTREMAALVRGAGADPDRFVARQVTAQLVARADVVLALTRDHRSELVQLHPPALRRSFTLRELARLLERVDPARLAEAGDSTAARLRAAVPLAAASRGGPPLKHPEDDDVPDPYLRGDAVYRDAFGKLAPAVRTIASVVRPRRPLPDLEQIDRVGRTL